MGVKVHPYFMDANKGESNASALLFLILFPEEWKINF